MLPRAFALAFAASGGGVWGVVVATSAWGSASGSGSEKVVK